MPSVLRAQQTLEAQVAALQRAVRRLQRRPPDPIESVNTVAASGSALTLPDVFTATMHDVTLTANCAITFPAATPGKSFALRLHGGFTVTWDSQARWHGGTAPILSSGVDTFWFVCFEAGRFECGVGGLGHS